MNCFNLSTNHRLAHFNTDIEQYNFPNYAKRHKTEKRNRKIIRTAAPTSARSAQGSSNLERDGLALRLESYMGTSVPEYPNLRVFDGFGDG